MRGKAISTSARRDSAQILPLRRCRIAPRLQGCRCGGARGWRAGAGRARAAVPPARPSTAGRRPTPWLEEWRACATRSMRCPYRPAGAGEEAPQRPSGGGQQSAPAGRRGRAAGGAPAPARTRAASGHAAAAASRAAGKPAPPASRCVNSGAAPALPPACLGINRKPHACPCGDQRDGQPPCAC